MRWKLFCRGLALLLAGVVGCKQAVYMTRDDVDQFKNLGLPPHLDTDVCVGTKPVTEPSLQPATVFSPDEPIRYLSLAEAIAIALEQGTVGNQSTVIQNIGIQGGSNAIQTSNDQPVNFANGINLRVGGNSDSIRVLRLDPAIVGAGIEASLSRFDAILSSSINWQNTDRPIATSTDAIQAGNQNIVGIVQEDVTATAQLVKPLPTGGVAGITFNVPYQLTNLPARVNPSYRPSLQIGLEQPLLQGFGVDINQIRPNFPGSVLFPGLVNRFAPQQAEGILIARLHFDQERKEFERNVHIMVANVEIAYWNLYYTYWNLYAQEASVRQLFEAWKITKNKYDAGTVGIIDLSLARGKYESARALRIGALNDVLEQERQLRGMLGMQGDDGKRLVPSDQPTLAPYKPDFARAQEEALALRPEIHLARQQVKDSQLNLLVQKNNLLPDLRLTGTYDMNAIGTRLDGPDQNNAFRNLSSNHFNSWSAGLQFSMPVGFRAAHTDVRRAQLDLARAFAVLQDQEQKLKSFLVQQYRRVDVAYELIRTHRSARLAYADQLRAVFALFSAGKSTLDKVLEAQQLWAGELSLEYQAIRDYNNSLASFEYAKGTILTRNNIVISEGALPTFAQQRAVEHLAERNAALSLRERPALATLPTCATGQCQPAVSPLDGDATLQNLWKQTPPLKDAPVLEPLPLGPKPEPLPLAPMPVSPAAPKELPTSRLPNAPLKPSAFGTARPAVPPTLDVPEPLSPASLPRSDVPVK